MMRERMMMRFGLVALVVILVLVTGGSALQQSAWTEGFLLGLSAGGDNGDVVSQYLLLNNRGYGFLGGVGLLFKFGAMIFFLFLGLRFLGMVSWKMKGHGHRHHWQAGPPWHWHHNEGEDSGSEASTKTSAAGGSSVQL